jgi:GNAT superfamily N-acetyltransferase
MSQIRRATSDEDIRRCFPVLQQLRPALDAAALVPQVRRMERRGFELAFVESESIVRAVAGYRIVELLRTGPMLIIDDLVTDAAGRSAGHGRALFEWLCAEARAQGCSVVELDSGVQRHEAHRFYFRERMHVLGYHLSLDLRPAAAP